MPKFAISYLGPAFWPEGVFVVSQNMSTSLAVADYYLGIDVSKAKLDVSFINAQSIELWADKIPNEPVAIAEYLLTVAGAYPGATIRCVVEATGTYHLTVAEISHMFAIGCLVYNPLVTKQGIKASVRGKKTDRTDALLIARMGLRGEGRLYVPEPYPITKHYARNCQKLSILNSSFQQYKSHFSTVLEGHVSAEASEVLQGIQTAIKEARTQMYKDLASSAKSDIFTRLQTIPGVGQYVAASILGEVQDMRRFQTSKELIAYAGLDPKIRQSGHSLHSTGALTKRGSGYLRRSIFIAANVARQHDPQFRVLYDKKRAEGKTYKEANCVVARKLLRVVRSVWLSDKDYSLPCS